MSKPQATSSERPGVKAPKKKDVFRKVLPDGTDAAILFQFARGGKPISEKEFWDMVHLIHVSNLLHPAKDFLSRLLVTHGYRSTAALSSLTRA